jgi:hypothetical protein
MGDALLQPRLRWLACFGALLVLLAPLTITELPPLLDYPNHLARTYVLAFGQEDPVLSRIYAQDWQIIPNLAIDVVLTGLVKVLPVYVAGRVMLGMILVLNYAAILLYSRAVFGRWSWWPVAAALMGYHALFLMGFMNYQVGIALAMMTAAGWHAFRDRYPVATVIAAAFAATLVFFCHIFGLVFCAVLIGSRELLLMWDQGRARRWVPLLQRAAAAGIVFVPSAVLYLSARLASANEGVITWNSPATKLTNLTEPFMNYYAAFDKLTALSILALVLACLALRMLRVNRASLLAAAICFLLYLAMPMTLKEASFIDGRFPIMLGCCSSPAPCRCCRRGRRAWWAQRSHRCSWCGWASSPRSGPGRSRTSSISAAASRRWSRAAGCWWRPSIPAATRSSGASMADAW